MSWPAQSAAVEDAFTARFGRPSRASVSFVGVDPIEILRFEPVIGERAYLTLGMSRLPMTGASEPALALDGPRAELMLRLRDPVDAFTDVWRRLAVLAAAPAVEGVVYRPDMTLDLGEPLAPLSQCAGVMVGPAPLPAVATGAGAVEVFELTPATPAEIAWCRARGAADLRARWAAQGLDLRDLTRPPARLD